MLFNVVIRQLCLTRVIVVIAVVVILLPPSCFNRLWLSEVVSSESNLSSALAVRVTLVWLASGDILVRRRLGGAAAAAVVMTTSGVSIQGNAGEGVSLDFAGLLHHVVERADAALQQEVRGLKLRDAAVRQNLYTPSHKTAIITTGRIFSEPVPNTSAWHLSTLSFSSSSSLAKGASFMSLFWVQSGRTAEPIHTTAIRIQCTLSASFTSLFWVQFCRPTKPIHTHLKVKFYADSPKVPSL